VTLDELGSTRLLTLGVIPRGVSPVKARYDYLPFGEEIGANYGPRSSVTGYNPSQSIRQKYTGYERDEESGLDYAQARYYANTLGRFISADSVGGSTTSPQTMNRYAYTGNNPLNNIDPSGHMFFSAQFNGSENFDDGGGEEYPDHVGQPTSEFGSQSFDEYNQRLQNMHDAAAAEAAYARGDTAAGDAIYMANDTLYTVNPYTGSPDNSASTQSSSGTTQQGNTFSAISSNATVTIIWDPVKGSINPSSMFGHVSYITMQDDQSWSWPRGILHPREWDQQMPSARYTDVRSHDSAGMGYVLDFGPKINAKFQKALKHAYDKGGGKSKHIYTIWNYNCGKAFNVAINAIRGDLRKRFKVNLPESKGIKPSTLGGYIEENLQPFIKGQFLYQKH
jgi:RHS repeat-associated protein